MTEETVNLNPLNPEFNQTDPETTPRTEKQREASRLNGAKSKGPVTPEGKATSSRNHLRSTRLAQSILLDSESVDSFNATALALRRTFRPKDRYEFSLVETMAVASWRRTRLVEMERAAIRMQTLPPDSQALEPAARAFLAYRIANADGSLEHFGRQAARLQREHDRAVDRLAKYRREAEENE
jgi:hypothetical protein